MSGEQEKPEAAAAGGGGGSKILLLVAMLSLVTSLGVGAVVVKFVVLDKPAAEHGGKGDKKEGEGHGEAKKEGEGHGEAKKEEGHGEKKEGEAESAAKKLLEIGSVTARLRNPELDRYARGVFMMEVATAEDATRYPDVKPKVMDAVLILLSDRFAEDLAGATGLQKLKADVRVAAESQLGKGSVKAVYITEFIIQ